MSLHLLIWAIREAPGIFEGVAILFSRESSQPRDQTLVSHIAGRLFTIWVTREACIFKYKQNKKLDK